MHCKFLLGVVALLAVASAQKLYFKPNRLIHEELNQYEQDKNKQMKGFGFKEPRKYFTGQKASHETPPKVTADAIVCPGNKSACPTGNTCCLTPTMAYGCCPLPLAVCCPDKKHCCPSRTKCDLIRQACISGVVAVPWYEKTQAISLDNYNPIEGRSVICPDGEHQCEKGQTCCKSAEGYSCCPLPKAVCCSDEVHCCPSGTTCDVEHSRCIKKTTGEFLEWFGKKLSNRTPKLRLQVIVTSALTSEKNSVRCDDKHVCPTGNTCCRMLDNNWGCCPKPEAVCCSDRVHCCPKGTSCDVSAGTCKSDGKQLDWFLKVPAKEVGGVKCDETHECQRGTTCCKLKTGQWGCCPLPEAVCCSDHVHCCPQGTTCDVSSGKCNEGDKQLDWFEKVPATEVGNVRCDATHECPSGNTCCKLSSGQWGCCRLREAVCCSDGVHCCPEGKTCDVSAGKCNGGDKQVDWYVKVPATKARTVHCDSTHECPPENTCCKLNSGQWGCCPLPEAVCCSDGVHCCPEGKTCDVSAGKCNGGDSQVDWFVKVPATEVGNVHCDSTHECPPENTCCKLNSGKWGCCPLPEAVCCSDGVHCCPEGKTCDVSAGKCNGGDKQVDWYVKVPATKARIVHCDSTHECPPENTCCKLNSGQWGCCPLPEAVCCSDGVHCCPEGKTCDVSAGKCNGGDSQVDWFVKVPATEVGNVHCDSTHECPPENTCCKLNSGKWGCCPLPEAVCCSDGVHCCPEGKTCDVSAGKCNGGDKQVDWYVKVPATKARIVHCDSTHECPPENTCCKLNSGQWGCCPLPEAVCCSDGVHCCPEGKTCDVSAGKCNGGDSQVDWFVKVPATEVGNVHCDSTHECPPENTCCKLNSDQWGCCPLPEAVCCSDGVHCCPEGKTCDVSAGKCNGGDSQVDWFVKVPATEVGNVHCDSTHECPPENTCCKLNSDQWGCCPLPEAVCCSDGVHCCPEGKTCDVSAGKCNGGDSQVDWFVKVPATEVGNVHCDSTHECPPENTCCKLNSDQWGCCPLPEAACCSDGVHCCPEGKTCDISAGKCNDGDSQVDWFVKVPATKVGNVHCDSTHECPPENTCCKLNSGQWGCCPLPEAVCCSDGVHCCPEGKTCDVSAGKCNDGEKQVDWYVKVPATKVGNVRCDSTQECPPGNTCCKLNTGQWGCCPLPKAVCCSDGVHCCPEGKTCDVSAGKCNDGDKQVDWFVKVPAMEVGNIHCDSTHECPSGNTCCRLKSGQWGCCPVPEAVCCADGLHCCPHGKSCDVSAGKCNGAEIKTDWLLTRPAVLKLEDVICPDGSECQDGQTCCEMNNGVTSYGCCPLPNAVCCDDGQHCCPQGYRCNLSVGVCIRGYVKLPWIRTRKRNNDDIYIQSDKTLKSNSIVQHTESSVTYNDLQKEIHENNVQCPDGRQCPSQYSCCNNGQGGYNCCPMPNGVCCDDHVHCCPHGYICDEEPGICRIPETRKAASDLIKKLGVTRGIPHV